MLGAGQSVDAAIFLWIAGCKTGNTMRAWLESCAAQALGNTLMNLWEEEQVYIPSASVT